MKSKGYSVIDDIDLPFIDDPAVIGKWKSVDFVRGIEDLKPGSRYTEGHLYSKELRFKEGGAFGVVADDIDTDNAPWYTWTKGVLMHSGDHTASRYIIKEIDGSRYLFVEWKSGDYIIRGQKPWYYVYTFEP
jgi:bla regulator protein BlaR1